MAVRKGLRSNLTAIARQCPEVSRDALVAAAADVHDISQQFVPVDTGALKKSSGVELVNRTLARVGYGTEYAKFQEFGTYKMSAQPFLRPAFMQAESVYARRMFEAAVKMWHSKYGSR